MSKVYEIKLSYEELKEIDGKVSDVAQKVIDQFKKEYAYGFSLPIINEILRKSEENGRLTWRYKQIRSCDYCDKMHDYYRYPRSGRFHSKGDKNFNKPMYYSGIKFNEGFVTIEGLGDMCSECSEKYNVINQLIDYILDNDLRIEIQKNDYRDSKYLKDDIRICHSCDYEMTESEMGKESTMMGDGYYPSTCPKCEAKSSVFGRSHKTTNKFKHRLNPVFKEEVQKVKTLIKLHNKDKEKDLHISLSASKKNENIFYVREDRFNNGYRTVIKFDVEKKIYYVGHFWKEKCNQFIEALSKYTETDNEYFDF
ncbi:hypothetical protein [Cytobacillus praedii]|uniref:hypothetical protein n=1 Tax=Cytobacillus praedii TaxID=1742358 RepID=UPI002E235F49|nr:hypothetical protein [Cytobacillus praedii]